jgi:hypothetical protein
MCTLAHMQIVDIKSNRSTSALELRVNGRAKVGNGEKKTCSYATIHAGRLGHYNARSSAFISVSIGSLDQHKLCLMAALLVVLQCLLYALLAL